jgi:hypothetical protein
MNFGINSINLEYTGIEWLLRPSNVNKVISRRNASFIPTPHLESNLTFSWIYCVGEIQHYKGCRTMICTHCDVWGLGNAGAAPRIIGVWDDITRQPEKMKTVPHSEWRELIRGGRFVTFKYVGLVKDSQGFVPICPCASEVLVKRIRTRGITSFPNRGGWSWTQCMSLLDPSLARNVIC